MYSNLAYGAHRLGMKQTKENCLHGVPLPLPSPVPLLALKDWLCSLNSAVST